MYKELVEWKAKIEGQLTEISNSLSNLQAPKQLATFSPSDPETWVDWLDGTNLDDVRGEDFGPLLDSNELIGVGQECVAQDPLRLPMSKPTARPCQDFVSSRNIELYKEEVTEMNRLVNSAEGARVVQ